MIYLDNSATTFPKPTEVREAINRAVRDHGFNPGRGGYRQSISASKNVYEARQTLGDFFNVPAVENVIFTSGCTESLNMAIKGVLKRGDHAVISSLEHNSVVRPLHKLSEIGYITYSVAEYSSDDDETVANFRRVINERTRLFVCTHASNVFGSRLPTERLCALAHSYGILFCLDAAQSAGLFDIDMKRDGYDLVCVAGHKYLYGPMGIGALLIGNDIEMKTLIEGGTGSESFEGSMPSFYPDRFEAGTLNIPGIAGLAAGVGFVKRRGIENIYRHEMSLIERLYSELRRLGTVKVYGDDPKSRRSSPVLSFQINGKDSEEVAAALSRYSDIAVRGGLHCAPSAHRSMGTSEFGTVRIAPSVFTTERDMRILANSLRKIAQSG